MKDWFYSTFKLQLVRSRRHNGEDLISDHKKNVEMKAVRKELSDCCAEEDRNSRLNYILDMSRLSDRSLDNRSVSSECDFEQISLSSSVNCGNKSNNHGGYQRIEAKRFFRHLKISFSKLQSPNMNMRSISLSNYSCFDVCRESDDESDMEFNRN
jgi:hypothetical protein